MFSVVLMPTQMTFSLTPMLAISSCCGIFAEFPHAASEMKVRCLMGGARGGSDIGSSLSLMRIGFLGRL